MGGAFGQGGFPPERVRSVDLPLVANELFGPGVSQTERQRHIGVYKGKYWFGLDSSKLLYDSVLFFLFLCSTG